MKLFRNFRKNLRTASDSAAKIKSLDDQVNKLSPKLKEQTARLKDAQATIHLQRQDLRQMNTATERLQTLCGKLAIQQCAHKPVGTPFAEVEFQVCSQWGEDGIIQHLVHHLNVQNRTFVEFGVENYREANTRFLLMNDNWRGLVFDGSQDHVNHLQNTELYWRYDLTAVAAFITPSNINSLIIDCKFGPKLGILSVDIDGMDYWVLKEIQARADILITEYNSVFGPTARVTIPPKDNFVRSEAHYSNLFYGMSLGAASDLAAEQGYDLVGVNTSGNNAFFVHRSVTSAFEVVKPEDCFVAAKFRESRDPNGELTFLEFEGRQREIADCLAYDLATGKERPLKEIL